MKESNNSIQTEILKTANGLSKKNLTAVLLYTKRLKSGDKKTKRKSNVKNIKSDLRVLSDIHITHLEQEFKDYKKLYPREK